MICDRPITDVTYFDLGKGSMDSLNQEGSSSPLGDNGVIYEDVLTSTDHYYIVTNADYFYQVCQIELTVDGNLRKSVQIIMHYYHFSPIHKISVLDTCRVKIDYVG